MNLYILIASLAVILILAGLVFYFQIRKIFRRQKNIERGLKMISLRIHLPPLSDDIDNNNRDQRDVIDEAISRSSTIYNIIASTIKKGLKSKYYGQRHFSFEIVGLHGFIYFYAVVPVSMIELVKQAIVSAYPSARLEEVEDVNIFNKLGKLNAVSGGEFSLKENFAYPIATYQETKKDGLTAILNSLASLSKEDGVAIQILLRPAPDKWRQHSKHFAEQKRTGHKSGVGEWAKSFATATVKSPEEHKEEPKKKELSNVEQAILDAVDEKTNQAGFETLIRVVVSTNLVQRSQSLVSNVTASFSVFNAPGKNGFKFIPTTNLSELVSDYILRIFPQKHQHMILNTTELATIFHFPDQRSIPTTQLTRQSSKQVDGPRNIPDEGLLLGYNIFRGDKKPIRLSLGDRQRHLYAVGQTGTGKSTFLENLAFQDMKMGNGFAFVDPHGDSVENIIAMVPKERVEDVIYFCPSDLDYPLGLNLFEFNNPDQKDFLIQESLNMLYKLYDPNRQGMMGARFENLFRNAALTVMASPEGGTFLDIPKLFTDPQYLKQKLEYVSDPTVREFWLKEMPQAQRSNDFGELVSWFNSKFGAFLSNEMMRNIIGQTKSSFDLREIMDNKKIFLVNLSKGRTGELNSNLLGMIFVMKFQAAAMSRSNVPEKDRVDFCLYVDEFQNFSTDSFATIMSEARKYHLNLFVANQFTTQLTEEIRDAVFGNIGTIVSFRVGQNDVEGLTKYFSPEFDTDDLIRLPNHNTIVRTLIGGVPTNPFSMATIPPLGNPNPELSKVLKKLSYAKYGRPRAVVESEIFKRLETKNSSLAGSGAFSTNNFERTAFSSPPPSTPLGTNPFAQPITSPSTQNIKSSINGSPIAQQPQVTNKAQSSFLDEWLEKRKRTTSLSSAISPVNNNVGSNSVGVNSNIATNTPPQLLSTKDRAITSPIAPQQTSKPVTTINSAQPLQTKSLFGENSLRRSPFSTNPAKPLSAASALDTKSNNESIITPDITNSQSSSTVSSDTDDTKNISSDLVDKQEVNNIAQSIEKELTLHIDHSNDPHLGPTKNLEPTSVSAGNYATTDELNSSNNQNLNNKEPINTASANDTIYIDQKGKLHDLKK